MKKILKVVGLSIVTLLVVLVGVAYLLPRNINVERDIVIEAPPSEVFSYVNSFEHFNKWSPWAQRDPNTKYEFSGPDSGVGARMEWESDNPNVGSGTQEIIASEPNEMVRSKLDFGEQGTGEAYFRLEDVEEGTRVTWGLDTDMGNNPVGRWMGLAMDSMIGSDYEKGLRDLKALIESEKKG